MMVIELFIFHELAAIILATAFQFHRIPVAKIKVVALSVQFVHLMHKMFT